MNILFRELNELYMGRSLSNNVVQYGEFAAGESDFSRSEDYWLSVFADEAQELSLITDFPRQESRPLTAVPYMIQ